MPADPSDPTLRFTDRATHYAAYRPRYAERAIDAALYGLPGVASDNSTTNNHSALHTHLLPVADVGAGTGISARQFADRGCLVHAVEPNVAMRDAARPHERVRFRDGAAERTGLLDNDALLVVCAQAFHWFDQPAALREFRRILAPSGRVALLWNVRRQNHPFMDAYAELVARHATGPIATKSLDDDDTLDTLRAHIGAPRLERFDNDDHLTFDETAGRALSASYVPNRGYAKDTFIAELAALFDQHRDPDTGRVNWAMQTRAFLADLDV